jgi:circadian clock protein KaiC
MVIIDGASRFADFAAGDDIYRHFVSDLLTQLATFGSTNFLLSNPVLPLIDAVAMHADCLIMLSQELVGARDVRMLRVQKLRGAPYLMGMHSFEITGNGLVVYPRLEARMFDDATALPGSDLPGTTGIPGLDDMLAGGMCSGSTSLVAGAPGSGKTTVGLHFVHAGVQQGEPGLVATFHEPPSRLLMKAAGMRLDLGPYVESGQVRIL